MNDLDDHKYLSEALEQAQLSYTDGNFPVGAVLVIDGKRIDSARNLLSTNSDWISHAEMNLIIKYSAQIKKSRNNGGSSVIYTSLEPCLMCLGTCTLNRISRIVYSCPDNFTGVAGVDFNLLPHGYKTMVPKLEVSAHFRDESKQLLMKYFADSQSSKWDKAKELMSDVE